MTTRDHQPLYRLTLTPDDLRTWAAPRFEDSNKVAIYRHCCPDGPQTTGDLHVARWPTIDPSAKLANPSKLIARSGGFEYAALDTDAAVWHANFANWDLFSSYGTEPFAQDEIQALEHPALGGVREALLARDLSTLVTDIGPAGPTPTPFTISGVQRRAAIDTTPRDDGPWPHGIYGQNFWLAPEEVVLGATRVIAPPTVSNILAMEAPAMGSGRYSPNEIYFVLLAAASAFAAARAESQRLWPGKVVEVHTGYWGCGAYGGDPVLTAACQIVSASVAGVDRLVFWTWDDAGDARLAVAREVADAVLGEIASPLLSNAATLLDSHGFHWGVSDGN